ncbi:GAF domain-containing sensor histidine kinase [Novosphingobium sp. AP12]|uniref:GAF domain-containing sensor histidine kinase n=1 Tax=Novosphingobium sp. AP12 TaxID=1144305 RepID=UPI00027205FD|nr:GAF domain-containing sensor histidine kinase [Novosphingobium sp. AP12]EJL22657.1 histidine kinase with GAF domain [Novosphingobium sp. AP12]
MGLLENDVEVVRQIDIVPTILDTVCRLTGMGFAAVARVTEDRWIACEVLDKIGFGLLSGGELKVESTICHEIRQSGQAVVISDVQADPVYCNHHTPAFYGLRSYISMPIMRADGSFFGTLCCIDPNPADLGRPEVQATFRMFADLLAFHLDAADKLSASEQKLAVEVEAGELREQFIAVVGHDLRNPLAAIGAGVTMLRKAPDPARAEVILDQMERSSGRMSLLIDNILDFARGRLGGGLTLEHREEDIAPVIAEVAAELAASHPGGDLRLKCDPGPAFVRCDRQRIAQLLSNLLGNAFTHGDPGKPITVEYTVREGSFALSVTNRGAEIPLDARARLFHPFARGNGGAGREGLGLGLYIASEIAKAHGGALSVASSPERTSFTFTMPLSGGA